MSYHSAPKEMYYVLCPTLQFWCPGSGARPPQTNVADSQPFCLLPSLAKMISFVIILIRPQIAKLFFKIVWMKIQTAKGSVFDLQALWPLK